MLGARGEFLLMVDADGATRFSDIHKLEAKMKPLAREPVCLKNSCIFEKNKFEKLNCFFFSKEGNQKTKV